MNPTSSPGLAPSTKPPAVSTADQPASWSGMLLVALPILLPGVLIMIQTLPLPVRGASAIVSGLAILLGGPFLLSHGLMRWPRQKRSSVENTATLPPQLA